MSRPRANKLSRGGGEPAWTIEKLRAIADSDKQGEDQMRSESDSIRSDPLKLNQIKSNSIHSILDSVLVISTPLSICCKYLQSLSRRLLPSSSRAQPLSLSANCCFKPDNRWHSEPARPQSGPSVSCCPTGGRLSASRMQPVVVGPHSRLRAAH